MTDRALALLARHYGRAAGALTASGAAAVEVALRRLGVCPGDEVIVPDHGCYKIAAAVVREGAVPVFASVGRAVVLDPAAIGAALSTRTRCIVAVHQYGLACPVGALRAASPRGIGIVEDAAQAWGTVGEGRPVGRDGDLTVTSFGSSKPVPVGAGGAVLGDDPAIAELVGSDSPGHRMLTAPPTPAPFPAPLLGELVRRLHRADALTARRRDRLVAAADQVGLRAWPEHDLPLAELPMFRHRHRAAPSPAEEPAQSADHPYLVVLSIDGRRRQAQDLVRTLAGWRSVASRER